MTPASFLTPPPLLPPSLHLFRHVSAPKRPRPQSHPAPKSQAPNPPQFSPPHLPPPPPPCLPQTIEHALVSSQKSLAHFLLQGGRLARIELPMGRSRKFWYRMSPLHMSVSESRLLALHFASIFRTLRVLLLLPTADAETQRVDGITVVHLDNSTNSDEFDILLGREHTFDVVMVAGVLETQRSRLESVLPRFTESAKATIMLNCFLDSPLGDTLPGFDDVYVCRAMDKVAVFKDGVGKGWAVFVEIAVFEYEWVGNKPDEWIPIQDAVHRFVAAKGAQKTGINRYYASLAPGCEAGFWPFMTISSVSVWPIHGDEMDRKNRLKAEKKRNANKRPFGFF